jgi:hypothetical protein
MKNCENSTILWNEIYLDSKLMDIFIDNKIHINDGYTFDKIILKSILLYINIRFIFVFQQRKCVLQMETKILQQ